MKESRVLAFLSVAGFVAILSSTASKSPTLPLFAEYLGAGPGEIGLIAAASTITGIVVNITAGTASDVYGRRELLVLSGFFFASAPFLYLFVTETWELVAVRVYHGVATAVFTPVAMAAIADAYRERRGKMMGYFSSATLAGRLLAPSIAGTAVTLYSFNWTYALCGAFGVAALIALLWVPELGKGVRRGGGSGALALAILANPRILSASAVMAVSYFAMQSIETFLPLYMKGMGAEPWLTGLVFTLELATIAILKPVGGRLYDRIGAAKAVAVGGTLSAAGVLAIALSTTYTLVAPSITVFAVGVALMTASVPPLVSEIAGEEARGTALGAMETVKDVGQALGPIVTGSCSRIFRTALRSLQ